MRLEERKGYRKDVIKLRLNRFLKEVLSLVWVELTAENYRVCGFREWLVFGLRLR